MLVKPEPKLGYAELLIATTSSRTCTKPTVSGSFGYLENFKYTGILSIKTLEKGSPGKSNLKLEALVLMYNFPSFLLTLTSVSYKKGMKSLFIRLSFKNSLFMKINAVKLSLG